MAHDSIRLAQRSVSVQHIVVLITIFSSQHVFAFSDTSAGEITKILCLIWLLYSLSIVFACDSLESWHGESLLFTNLLFLKTFLFAMSTYPPIPTIPHYH